MSGGKDRQRDHDGRDRDYRGHDYGRTGMGYEPESRFRDSRGREHYNDGRYAPMNYAPMGHYDDDYSGGSYWTPSPYIPPMYNHYGESMRQDEREYPQRPMNRIGFNVSGDMEKFPPESRREYHSGTARYGTEESAHRTGGHMEADGHTPFTREEAMIWTRDMVNSDGSRGPHWNMDQVQQVMEQRGINCDPAQFYAVLNAVYSDYYAVAKKYGLSNKMDFYVDLAKAWLDDDDAVKDKVKKYFDNIVKH